MTKGMDAVGIWLESDYPWYYTKDRLRRGVIKTSVESFVHNSTFRGESGSRLASYTSEAVIPVITAAALAYIGVELREDVISLIREIGVAAVDPMVFILTVDWYDLFYRAVKQLKETAGWTADEVRFAIRTTRVLSLESLEEIASDQEVRQDWFAAVQRIAREYQSGNYGNCSVVGSATKLDDQLDRYVGSEPFQCWLDRKEERKRRSAAGKRHAEEIEQNVIEQRRAEERARAEYYEKMAEVATMYLTWRRNTK